MEGTCATLCGPATCPNGCCSGEFTCVAVADQPAAHGNCSAGGAACAQCAGSCDNGVCTAGAPSGKACTPGSLVRADGQAECTTYAGRTPTGTFCLLQPGEFCLAPEECIDNCCSGSFRCCLP